VLASDQACGPAIDVGITDDITGPSGRACAEGLPSLPQRIRFAEREWQSAGKR